MEALAAFSPAAVILLKKLDTNRDLLSTKWDRAAREKFRLARRQWQFLVAGHDVPQPLHGSQLQNMQ